MHEIGHLAESSDQSSEEIAETMRKNGTYQLLEEEIARQKALDFLVENAVPVSMPEEEKAEDVEGTVDEDVENTETVEATAGEARAEQTKGE